MMSDKNDEMLEVVNRLDNLSEEDKEKVALWLGELLERRKSERKFEGKLMIKKNNEILDLVNRLDDLSKEDQVKIAIWLGELSGRRKSEARKKNENSDE